MKDLIRWFKKIIDSKPIRLCLSLIVILIVGLLLNNRSNLKQEFSRIKQDLKLIEELYPNLEVSKAVDKMLKDYNTYKRELNNFRQKEEEKIYKPLDDKLKKEIIEQLKSFKEKSKEEFSVRINCSFKTGEIAKDLEFILKKAGFKVAPTTIWGVPLGNGDNVAYYLDRNRIDYKQLHGFLDPLSKFIRETMFNGYDYKNESFNRLDKKDTELGQKDGRENVITINIQGRPRFRNNGVVFFEE